MILFYFILFMFFLIFFLINKKRSGSHFIFISFEREGTKIKKGRDLGKKKSKNGKR